MSIISMFNAILCCSHDITYWEETRPIPRQQLLEAVHRQHALFCTLNDRIDAAVLDAASPTLKVIGTMSVG